jgi:3'-phosphoadenosine 5'-phosphosulfate sulfotransferase (PAPS reductase)/FAD synthetase
MHVVEGRFWDTSLRDAKAAILGTRRRQEERRKKEDRWDTWTDVKVEIIRMYSGKYENKHVFFLLLMDLN